MLTELKLSNFRIFDDEVTVRFRPITVLIGRNSSGKSSIIKFLLMLQQSMAPGRSRFLTAEGDRVSLGVFSELKNSLTHKRNLTFELTVENSAATPGYPLSEYLESFKNVDHGNLLYKAKAKVSYNRKTSMGNTSYSLVDTVSGERYLEYGSKILDDTTFGEFPARNWDRESPPELKDDMQSRKRYVEWMDRRNATIIRSMSEVQMTAVFSYIVDSIRHLSPARDESQRVIVAAPPPEDSVGQRGQYTLPHLQEMMSGDRDRYEFIQPHLRSVANIEGVRFRKSSGYVSRALAKNQTTGAEVPIADYGFGVSQCLPIFVQGAIADRYTSLMIEQPEAQLHPTAQLELGSYFADLWNQRKVGSIIETHSGNILMRLRRLIAKEELSHRDVSVAFFTFDEEEGHMPVVRNLDINQDGSMQAGLPMEFFGADVIEGLQLGARV